MVCDDAGRYAQKLADNSVLSKPTAFSAEDKLLLDRVKNPDSTLSCHILSEWEALALQGLLCNSAVEHFISELTVVL